MPLRPADRAEGYLIQSRIERLSTQPLYYAQNGDDIVVGPDVITLRRQLSELLPGGDVGARISNDSIVLEGIVVGADGSSAGALVLFEDDRDL